MVDEEAAMLRSVESMAGARGYCRMKRRDWGIDVTKMKEVEQGLFVCLALG